MNKGQRSPQGKVNGDGLMAWKVHLGASVASSLLCPQQELLAVAGHPLLSLSRATTPGCRNGPTLGFLLSSWPLSTPFGPQGIIPDRELGHIILLSASAFIRNKTRNSQASESCPCLPPHPLSLGGQGACPCPGSLQAVPLSHTLSGFFLL